MNEPYTCPLCGRTSHHPIDVRERYCGHCHAFAAQLMAFRLYVAGELVRQHWITAGSERLDSQVPEEHAAICRRAEAAGLRWRLEIYDAGSDRTVRLGSSSEGMVAPEPVDLWEGEELLRRMSRLLGYS